MNRRTIKVHYPILPIGRCNCRNWQGMTCVWGWCIAKGDRAILSKALSTISHIAEDGQPKQGMSKEDALAHLTSGGVGVLWR